MSAELLHFGHYNRSFCAFPVLIFGGKVWALS